MNKNRAGINLIVGLEIGISKIAVVVGEIKRDGTLEVIGVGMHESSGMKNGMVVNIDTTDGAIQRAQGDVGLKKCLNRCAVEANKMILLPLPSCTAVLTEDEKDLGVCLIDIGGSTTDVAIFSGGAIRHTAVIPIAGDQITNDIAMAFGTSIKDAEDIKIKYGCALRQLADDAPMEVTSIGGQVVRMLSRQPLADVIEPRVEELYSLVMKELRRSDFEDLLTAGAVITGGGSAMRGMAELGEECFHMPVRQVQPEGQESC